MSHSSLQESTELRPKRVLVVVSGCTSYLAGFMVVVWLLLQAFFLVPFGRDVEKPEQSADCNIGRQKHVVKYVAPRVSRLVADH